MNTPSLQSPTVGSPSNMPPVLDQEPTDGSAEIGPEENSTGSTTSMPTEPKTGPKNLKIPHMPKKVEEKAVEETPIADTILEIENLKKEEAIQCVSSLLEEKKNVDFKLGGVLAAILRNKWFAPHDTFSEFVEIWAVLSLGEGSHRHLRRCDEIKNGRREFHWLELL